MIPQLGTDVELEVCRALRKLQYQCHQNSVMHGFYENPDQNVGEKLALIHSEISEALDAHRKGGKQDDHCPTYPNFNIELADAVIRILDLCEWQKIDLASAILAKHEYNRTRPFKHGKNY